VLSEAEVVLYAAGKGKAVATVPHSSSQPAEPSSSQPAEPDCLGQQLAAADHQEAPGAGIGAGSGEASASSSQPIFWGRQTFVVESDDMEDKTSFFANIEEGPPIADSEPSVADVIAAAADGCIPLAACIKITQAYQETVEDQVALLLAGALCSLYIYIALCNSQDIGICCTASSLKLTCVHVCHYIVFN